MTLTTRLSLYFLATLAFVLVGFSTTLYVLARIHLYRQMDERLDTALNTLVAAAEIDQNGVEWDMHERRLDLGQYGSMCWTVSDGRGRCIDRSGTGSEQPFDALLAYSSSQETGRTVAWQGQTWRFSKRRIEATPSVNGNQRGQEGNQDQKHTVLVVAAGISEEPVLQTLRTLALASAGVSLAIWAIALFFGRWICRRAVAPVSRMAWAARQMQANDLAQRLWTPATGDELEDLGRAFNDLLQRLEESFQRQQRFTGDASHQLRTPLTAIIGQIEVARRRERGTEEYERVLDVVHERAAHLRKIVEMLLFLARADSDAGLPDLETIDIAEWVRGHVESWSEHPRAADLRLSPVANTPIWVKGQPALLGQLVDNLLDNACKYSTPGTAITLRLGGDEKAVSLTIEDEGVGIAPEELPHVFEPFHRSAEARKSGTDGVGLGLAIAQRIAMALGGRITVTSKMDHGSCFTIWLVKTASGGGPVDHDLRKMAATD